MSPRTFPILIPIIVGCAQFMHQFDGAVIANAVPAMAASLAEDPLRLNLAITCYLLALAVFVPVSGWLADRYGSKRVYMSAIALFTVSSLACGLSTSLWQLVIARTVQGIGGAMMTPVGRVIVAKSVPKNEIIRAMAFVTIPGVMAPLLGPPVGGFIVTFLSWPWIFYINLPVGAFGLFMVWRKIPDIREANVGPFDFFGFALTAFSMATLVRAFDSMGRDIIPNWALFTLIGSGLAAGALYVRHALASEKPIVDLRLLRFPTLRASVFGGGLFFMGSTSVVFLLSLLFQIGFGLTAFQSGLITFAVAAGALSTRFVIGNVIRVIGYRRLLAVNALVTAAYLFTCGGFDSATPYAVMVGVLFIGGVSRSLQFTSVQTLCFAEVPAAVMSRATSFSAMTQQLAQTFGVGLCALTIHASTTWRGHDQVMAQDVSPAFMMIGLLTACSTLIFWRLPKDADRELRR